MASTIKVNTLDTQSGTNVTIAAGKKISGANTQYRVTGGASGQVLINDGSDGLSWATAGAGFNDVNQNTAVGSTIYTVPSVAAGDPVDITKLLVIITGGGGSGSAGIAATANGGGGCSAGTVMARVTVVPGDTITTIIGAGGLESANTSSAGGNIGGDSSFTHTTGTGSFGAITAPGGRAGVTYNSMPASPVAPTVGVGNEGIAIKGGSPSGDNNGSASFWGSGGSHGIPSVVRGTAGEAFGSGGGGGTYTAGLYVGSAGMKGVCFIMEFE